MPSKNSSIIIVSPAAQRPYPSLYSLIFIPSSFLLQITTPFPRHNPSAFITNG